MPSLAQSLHGYDLGHLRIIAQFWGVELRARNFKAAVDKLSESLLNNELTTEIITSLPSQPHAALKMLIQSDGRLPWAYFVRHFGEIRDLGPGRRDREKNYLNPVSAAEVLFYRAMIARAFFDSPSGAQEFAYIPDDLLEIISVGAKHTFSGTSASPLPVNPTAKLGRLARPDERAHIAPANTHILDDLTTLLAVLRLGWEEPPFSLDTSLRFARDLLPAARLVSGESIQADSVKVFLEAERDEALAQLLQTWRESETINELHQIPALICEGEWTNAALDTRNRILEFLEGIPPGKWWSLNGFISDIKKEYPDFQRPAGDYDSWFIRRAADDMPLRGFEHWEEVDGALIRYLVTGPLYWLGWVDLALAKEEGEVTAFRMREKPVSIIAKDDRERKKIIATSSGQITISRFAPRVARYQISRFCKWEEGNNPDEYRYQISPSSLERAREQGLKTSHLLGLLQKYSATKIPPSLVCALQRWELNGTEARVGTMSVLRLSRPEDLEKLRKSKTGRFLGEVLGPAAVIVKAGASSKVMAALIEMGIFMKDES